MRYTRELSGVAESPLVRIATAAEAMPGSIKLCYGESDMPTPAVICEAADAAIKAGHTFYTHTAGYRELREAIAGKIHELHGVSYRASNWQQWMEVRARPYLYYDKNYMSLREMRTRFSSASIDELCAADSRAEKSRAKLLNSLIFCRRVHGTTEPVPAVDQRRISR